MNQSVTGQVSTLVTYRQSNFEDYKKGTLNYDGAGNVSLQEEDGAVIFSSPLTQIKSQSTSNFFIVWFNKQRFIISPLVYLVGQGATTKKEMRNILLLGPLVNFAVNGSRDIAKMRAQRKEYNKDREYYVTQMKQWNTILSSGGAKRRSTVTFVVIILAVLLLFMVLIARTF